MIGLNRYRIEDSRRREDWRTVSRHTKDLVGWAANQRVDHHPPKYVGWEWGERAALLAAFMGWVWFMLTALGIDL